MAVSGQIVTEEYALYCGDSREVMATLPEASVHLSIYSPPFSTTSGGMYHYSSAPQDLSNNDSYEAFMSHYEFFVAEVARLMMPGRSSLVHCIDVPSGNTGRDHLRDFPGDIIRLHERHGFLYAGRYHVWKEPLTVRNRTLTKGLAHKTIVEDSAKCSVASADYLLRFRRAGENPLPIAHPVGLTEYAGERKPPADVLPYRGWTGKQTENRYSHWVWRQYASAFWDDVRLDRVLPYRQAREEEDEKHVHPLQLDVIERGVILWSNPGEVVLSPFMGVGSEVYGAVRLGRRAIGVELKASYYRQAVKNVASAHAEALEEQAPLFANMLAGDDEAEIEDETAES